MGSWGRWMALALLAGAAWTAAAELPQAAGELTLAQAINQAWTHYPSLAAAQAAATRALAVADEAHVAFWPTAGFAGQWDRATDNASPGLAFSSPLPGISGSVPVSIYSQRSTWTSAAGLYFSWEVADFGRRAANVRYYRQLAAAAGDQAAFVRLQVGAHAADAYLNVLAAGEQLRVAQGDESRWNEIATTVQALVDQQLRPGADASRAQAELAQARIRIAAAERNRAQAEATLTEALGLDPAQAMPTLAGLAAAPQPPALAPAAPPPQVRVQVDTLAAAQAQVQEAARAALPRWYALGSAYGRGTGIAAPGQLGANFAGLSPTTAANWAVGLGVDFSFTRWRANRDQRAEAAAAVTQQQQQLRQVNIALTAARRRADADWTAAASIARQSPIALQAAQVGEQQARVRYQAGLAGVVDLANAEQLLAQADSDEALSRLQLWRALVESAYAAGDLQPLLGASRP